MNETLLEKLEKLVKEEKRKNEAMHIDIHTVKGSTLVFSRRSNTDEIVMGGFNNLNVLPMITLSEEDCRAISLAFMRLWEED